MAREVRALSREQSDELFAYFWSVRHFDPRGEAIRGKRYFSTKGCASCHALTPDTAVSAAPPVSEWPALANPVLWAQDLWNHTEAMEEAMAAKGEDWPTFSEQEMVDLLIYLQNLRPTRDQVRRLSFSSPTAGRALFEEKGCSSCHSSDTTFLTNATTGSSNSEYATLTGFAAAMWNHAPEMTRAMAAAGATRATFSAAEMGDLISFVYYNGGFEEQGRASKGGKVYAKKGCQSCHGDPGSDVHVSGRFSVASMTSAAWVHTPEVLGDADARSLPGFAMSGRDMANLIAYLNQ